MRLLYFAWVKEKAGIAAEEVAPPDGVATIAELIDWLKARGPEFADAFATSEVIRAAIDRIHVRHDAKIAGARWRVAVNQQMADLATPVKPGDEIAFFPPVTGG